MALLAVVALANFFFARLIAQARGAAARKAALVTALVFDLGLSYVVDVERGTLAAASLLDVAVYVAFFPYLLAGPIARASDFLPQLRRPRDSRRIDASRAFFLIFAGLVKKMLIADYVATHLVLNAIYRRAAAARPGVVFVDTWSMFATPQGTYSAYLRDAHGDLQLMRQSDGVHMTLAGASRLGWAIVARIERDYRVRDGVSGR